MFNPLMSHELAEERRRSLQAAADQVRRNRSLSAHPSMRSRLAARLRQSTQGLRAARPEGAAGRRR